MEPHESVADVPIAKGGAGAGFGPHELVEAALATCMTMTVQMFAAKHDMPLAGAICKVHIDRSLPDQIVLRYMLDLDGPLTEDQARQLREAAEACPVGRTLTGPVAIRSMALDPP